MNTAMWYGKQASPASSTSTVDQQEILFDQQTSNIAIINNSNISNKNINNTINNTSNNITNNNTSNSITIPATPTVNKTTPGATTTTTTTRRQGTKRPRNTTNNRQSIGASKTNSNSNATGNNNKCSPPKRPKLYHLPQQLAPWKSLQHHFLRYTDVKFRPEKRMTMAELGNEVLQRRNGWKVHHLVGQLTDLMQNELQTREKIASLLHLFVDEGAKRIHDLAHNCHKLPEQYAALLQSQRSYGKNEFKTELIVTKLDDLLRGDLQRSNMFDDQLRDCRELIVRITNEHRDRVARITTKFNKRIQL